MNHKFYQLYMYIINTQHNTKDACTATRLRDRNFTIDIRLSLMELYRFILLFFDNPVIAGKFLLWGTTKQPFYLCDITTFET